MEYMENTFKMRKETKYDMVLCNAKSAQKEKAYYIPDQIRAKHMEKMAQTQTK